MKKKIDKIKVCKYCGRHRENEIELLGCCIDCAHDKRPGNHKPMIFYHPSGCRCGGGTK